MAFKVTSYAASVPASARLKPEAVALRRGRFSWCMSSSTYMMRGMAFCWVVGVPAVTMSLMVISGG